MSISSISSSNLADYLSSYDISSMTDEELEEINSKLEEEYAEAVKNAASGSSSTTSTATLYANLTESAQDTNDLLETLKEAADSGDTDSIRQALSDFATSYNSLMTYLKSTGSTECTAIISAMTTYLKNNEDALNAAGITISSSTGKLTIDSDTLASADMTDLAEVFSSSSSTMKEMRKLATSALSVASMKSSHYEAISSLYDGSGSINSQTLTKTFLDMMS